MDRVLTIDTEQITVNGWGMMEDLAGSDLRNMAKSQLVNLLAHFIDSPDKPNLENYETPQEFVDACEAHYEAMREFLGWLTLSQLKDAFLRLVGAFNKAEADAIPPAQAGGSA